MAEPKSILSEPMPLDMDNRDPNNMNDHVRVLFEDAFGEPDGSHSMPGVWSMSYKTFGGVKNCCYFVLSVLCGCPLAFCWALEFACVQCCHIWCIGPCIKMWNMNFSCLKLFWSSCVHCMCDPCYEACALCFSLIRVQNKNG
ncbi:caveolin-3-like isoform X1 [Bufo gargarizans]|uniref:caveolin-3-like isoform X1 n=1 Tax=Bufo gargarizans TaxID=30331 RepID=UPI001CF32F3F|nr:caveolin-3-like isoform X1 [Bufo gargarizans]